jgi:uncharacterized protein
MTPPPLQILIDADACPVKEEVYRVAERHGVGVHVVANAGLRVPQSPLIRRVIVDGSFDAADNWIAERATPASIVITADIPLAARCLEAGAQVITHTGQPFTEQAIGMALAMRGLMQDLRAMGQAGGGNAPFSPKDRSRFLEALERGIVRLKRAGFSPAPTTPAGG